MITLEHFNDFVKEISLSNSRTYKQDILFKSPGLSQQEEKQLQQKLKSVQEKLDLIGSVIKSSC